MSTRKHPADGGVQVGLLEWQEQMPEKPPEHERCVNYDDCRNVVKRNGMMCSSCLDEVRRKDREERDERSAY